MPTPALAGMIVPPAFVKRMAEPTDAAPVQADVESPRARERVVVCAVAPRARRRKIRCSEPPGIAVAGAVDDCRAIDERASVAGQITAGGIFSAVVVDGNVAHVICRTARRQRVDRRWNR